MAEGDDDDSVEGAEISVTVDYDGFLTRIDVTDILLALDSAVLSLSERGFYRRAYIDRFVDADGFHDSPLEVPAFFAIRSFQAGSLILTGVISITAARYGKRLLDGYKKARVEDQLSRLGNLGGAYINDVLAGFNDWAENYVKQRAQRGGRVASIKAVRSSNKRGSSLPPPDQDPPAGA